SQRLSQLMTFLEESPNDSFLMFAVAKEYEKLEELGNAKEYYEKLVANDPNYVGTYYHLGKLHEEEEELTKALDIYQKGIEVAKKIKDQHALSELMGAKMNLELEL
ncbi:MAG: tetratricopeptide repeat protein, partial [Bacteroidota bacterium]